MSSMMSNMHGMMGNAFRQMVCPNTQAVANLAYFLKVVNN